MTPTHAPADVATIEAEARHNLMLAFADAAIWTEISPGARLPSSPVINVRVRGGNPGEKLADLQAIADSWNVPVTTLDDGTRYAERVFGPLTIEAHVAVKDATIDDLRNRTDRARAARKNETEAAA
jgi:hypothetical protein